MVFKVFGRLVGRFLRSIGRFLLGGLRFVGRHETALGVIVVAALLVAGIFVLLSVLNVNIVLGQPQAVVVPTPTAAPATPTPTPTKATQTQPQVSAVNAPASTETFLQGEVYFDSGKVWDSLNAALHTSLQGQGQDQKYFDQILQDAKSKGRQYIGYQFVGSYKDDTNQVICFYVVRYREDNKTVEQPYTFWLDDQGKIAQFNS